MEKMDVTVLRDDNVLQKQNKRGVKMISIGWHRNLSMEQYHLDKDTFSKSNIARFSEVGPVKYKWEIDNKVFKSGEAYDIGTAAHTLILEGDEFEKRVATNQPVPPKSVLAKDGSRRGKSYKIWEEENLVPWKEENSGKIQLKKSEDIDLVKRMAECVLKNNDARCLLTNGEAEVTGVFNHECGLRIKVRPDRIPFGTTMTDLKTIRDLSLIKSESHKLKYRYSAYLSTLCGKALTGDDWEYWFVFIDKHKSPEVAIRKAPKWMTDNELGPVHLEVTEILNDLAECVKTGKWESTYFGYDFLRAPQGYERMYYISEKDYQ